MYKLKDYQDTLIHLYKDDWSHIIAHHPEMKGHLDKIKEALHRPDFIFQDPERKNTVVYHKKFEQVTINNISCSNFYLRVPVDIKRGLIKTAFFSPQKKRGELIWQKVQKD